MKVQIKNKAMFEKMVKARVQLLINMKYALIANLVMLLDLIEDESISTAATNGEVIKYNPNFIAGLSLEETKAVLAHEALHCVLLHHTRRGYRNPKFWNIAGDIVINLMIIESDLKLPECALNHPEYKDMSTEQVYNLVVNLDDEKKEDLKKEFDKGNIGDYEEANGGSDESDSDNETKDSSGADNKKGKGKKKGSESASSEDKEIDDKKVGSQKINDQESKWKVHSKLASQVASKMGSDSVGEGFGGLQRIIDDVANPLVDWQTLLRIFADKVVKNEFSWNKPNRRLINRGLYLPSRSGRDLGNLVVVIDTSGSVSQDDLNQIAAELNEIRSIYTCKIIVLYVDSKVANVEEYETYDELNLVPHGGGGTSFIPAFDWLEEHDEIEPTCLIYFTDGLCYSYPEEPSYPVLWIGTRSFTPKFGDFALMSCS